jgi:hypothetical protein
MTTPEVESIEELIADCAEIPTRLRSATSAIPLPRLAAGWTVPDSCLDQVRDIEDY